MINDIVDGYAGAILHQNEYNFKLNPESKSNKRNLIYVNNVFTATKPIIINYELNNNSNKTPKE